VSQKASVARSLFCEQFHVELPLEIVKREQVLAAFFIFSSVSPSRGEFEQFLYMRAAPD
jgi:hypothetical protein